MVVFYDAGGSALLLESNNFLMSYASYDDTLYPCSFVVVARTYQPDNTTQLVALQGIQLTLNQQTTTTTFVTNYGVWVRLFIASVTTVHYDA